MKINEVTVASAKSLFEAIDRENRTGFLTEDLVRIVQEEQSCNWKEMTFEELMAEMDEWDAE